MRDRSSNKSNHMAVTDCIWHRTDYTSRLSDTSKIKILFHSHSCTTPLEDILISNAV